MRKLRIKQLSKEELRQTSFIELAHVILEENKQVYHFQDLLDEITSLLEVSKTQARKRLVQFYTDLNIDGRFIALSDNRWGLREWYPVDQIEEETVPTIKTKPKKKKKSKKAKEEEDLDLEDFDDLEDEELDFDDLDDTEDDDLTDDDDDDDDDDDLDDLDDVDADDDLDEDEDLEIDGIDDLDDDDDDEDEERRGRKQIKMLSFFEKTDSKKRY